jgi:hypothetical protein
MKTPGFPGGSFTGPKQHDTAARGFRPVRYVRSGIQDGPGALGFQPDRPGQAKTAGDTDLK